MPLGHRQALKGVSKHNTLYNYLPANKYCNVTNFGFHLPDLLIQTWVRDKVSDEIQILGGSKNFYSMSRYFHIYEVNQLRHMIKMAK